MSKKDLAQEVADLINEVERTHRYSMTRIYSLYNEVFEKNESPQSCASCLMRKIRELKDWLETKAKEEKAIAPESNKEQKPAERVRKNRSKKQQ